MMSNLRITKFGAVVLFCFYLIINSSLSLFGQEVADKGKRIQAKLQKIYNEGIKENELTTYMLDGPGMPPSANAIWIAYAAKEGVPVYSAASESSQMKEEKLPLFSEYMVFRLLGASKAYKDAWLEIIESSPFGISKDLVIERPLKRFGYVKASDMLVWDHSLRDEKNQYMKILAVHDVNSLAEFSSQSKTVSSNLQLYDGPDLTNALPNAVPLLDFLFVYKTQINASGKKVYLLGRSESLEKGAQITLLGWAPEGLLKKWPGRLVLEPNTDAKAAAQRSKSTYDYKLAMNQGQYDNIQNVLTFKDPGGTRWEPLRKRIPIFKDQSTKDEYKVSFITSGESSSESNSAEDIKNKEKYTQITQNTRKINLILVIDGSTQTAPYKSKVVEAFTKLNELLENKKSSFEYSIGGVVYRDIEEKNCNGEDRSIELINPSNNRDAFVQRLEGIAYGNCKDKDPSNQNLLDGILKACDMFDGKKDESNFILIMGAGGDMRMNSGQLISQIVPKIVANKVNIMSNQFFNSSESGYQAFNRQIKEICQAAYSQINASTGKSYPAPKFKKCRKNTYCLDYPNESVNIAHLYNSLEGEQFSPEEFLYSIENSFVRIQNELEKLIQEAQNYLIDFETKGVAPALCAKLQAVGLPCDIVKKNKISLMVEAYTRYNDPILTEPVYSRSLFLTTQELMELENFYQRVTENSSTISEMRTNTYNAIFDYVRTFVGKKESTSQAKKTMATMSGKDFVEAATGAPPNNEILKKIKSLSDIQNSQIVTDDEIDNLNKLIKSKLLRLTQQAKNKCKFQNAEQDYYWLPVDWLP